MNMTALKSSVAGLLARKPNDWSACDSEKQTTPLFRRSVMIHARWMGGWVHCQVHGATYNIDILKQKRMAHQ